MDISYDLPDVSPDTRQEVMWSLNDRTYRESYLETLEQEQPQLFRWIDDCLDSFQVDPQYRTEAAYATTLPFDMLLREGEMPPVSQQAIKTVVAEYRHMPGYLKVLEDRYRVENEVLYGWVERVLDSIPPHIEEPVRATTLLSLRVVEHAGERESLT